MWCVLMFRRTPVVAWPFSVLQMFLRENVCRLETERKNMLIALNLSFQLFHRVVWTVQNCRWSFSLFLLADRVIMLIMCVCFLSCRVSHSHLAAVNALCAIYEFTLWSTWPWEHVHTPEVWGLSPSVWYFLKTLSVRLSQKAFVVVESSKWRLLQTWMIDNQLSSNFDPFRFSETRDSPKSFIRDLSENKIGRETTSVSCLKYQIWNGALHTRIDSCRLCLVCKSVYLPSQSQVWQCNCSWNNRMSPLVDFV